MIPTAIAECSKCGDSLHIAVTSVDRDNDIVLSIKPCKECLAAEYLRGYEDGQGED